jgi:CRP-like cAMP-binding protein
MTSHTSTERVGRLLAAHPFSKGLDPAHLDLLAEQAELVEFASGEVIFDVGTDADTFYLIRSGLVALEVASRSGVPRVIQQIAEGSVLGWSWLFAPYEWQFAAVARSPVRAIAFDAATLRQTFAEIPSCGYAVLSRVAEVMADRLHASRRQMMNLMR